MCKFENIEEIIRKYSRKDWSELGNYSEERSSKFESEIINFVTTNSQNLFLSLVRFVISGEYLLTSNVETRVESLKSDIDSAIIPDISLESRSASILAQVSKSYKNWLDDFECLNMIVNHHINEYGAHWAVELYKKSSVETVPLEFLAGYSFAFKEIIKLINIDFFLSSNINNQISSLLIIRDKLQNQEFARIFSADIPVRMLLVDKCNLLINKIEKSNNKKYKYSLNGSEYSEHKKIEYFNHYIIDFNVSSELDAQNQIVQKKNESEWEFKDYYVRMKVLKEQTGSADKAQDVYDRFGRLVIDGCPFNLWAHRITKVFLYNNCISLKLSKSNLTLKEIESVIEEVSTSHVSNGIKNYFPFLKISLKIIDLIKTNITSLTLEEINEYIKVLERSNELLRATYDWSKVHLNWAFQPSFEECRYEKNGVVIFTASAYSTPVNYSDVEDQIQKVKEESAIVKGFSSTLVLNNKILEESKETAATKIKELQEENNVNADKKIEELQKENRDLLKKNVEVLSIFAAIVLFVVGNIQLFTQLKSLKAALLFMLVFAYIISMFILLIRLTTRNYKTDLGFWECFKFNLFETIHIVLMAIATAAILFILCKSGDVDLVSKNISNEGKPATEKIDSKRSNTVSQKNYNSVQVH